MSKLRKAGLMLAACAALGGNSSTSPPPVYLDVAPHGETLRIQVLGHAERQLSGHYELEVVGASSNRSRQRGAIRIPADADVILATVQIGISEGQEVAATLIVTLDDRLEYELRYDRNGLIED